ncbi:uncharacterized protein LOC144378798 [Halichoerus grypus]
MCHRAGKVQGYSPEHCGRIPEWRSQAKLCREPTMCVREGEPNFGSSSWGAPARTGGGGRGPPGSPQREPAPRGSSAEAARRASPRFAALPGVPRARGLARSGRIGPSCRRRLLLPPPSPPPPAARSALLLLQPRWLAPNPHPPGPGAPAESGSLPAGVQAGRGGGAPEAAGRAGARASGVRVPLQPCRGGRAGLAPARRAPPPPRRRAAGSRVNELDFGYLEGGDLPCTLSVRARGRARVHTHTHTHTHTLTHTHTHHSPPPKFRFSARGGWGRGGSKGCPDNGERKSCIQKFLTSLKKKSEKLTTVTQKNPQICSSTWGEEAATDPALECDLRGGSTTTHPGPIANINILKLNTKETDDLLTPGNRPAKLQVSTTPCPGIFPSSR